MQQVEMYQFIAVQCEGGVGRLTLARPEKRNALKRDFIEEIHRGLSELKSNPDLRVMVLQAEGSVFCAGMDLGEMQQRAQSDDGQAEWQRDSEVYCDVLLELFTFEVPTIAAVSGPALAGGVGLVLACDMIVAADNAFFSLPEPMRGITAAMVTPFLIHRVGAGAATSMLLAGERLATTSTRAGALCHDVVPADDVPDRVDSLTRSIMTGSRSALAITKRHLSNCVHGDIVAQVKMSVQVSAEARETEDAREGLAAFLEKRKPSWQA